jgi:hypothetical protein
MRTNVRAVILSTILVTTAAFTPIHYGTDEGGVVVEEVPLSATTTARDELNTQVRQYLESKNSPLANDVEHLTSLEHWKLLIAISAIESQYCKRQLSYNCWGIGGDSAYRHYSSFQEAATDADALITRWQARGRWHTVEDMNCHYVVPCNPNWVRVVNNVLNELDAIDGTTTKGASPEDARRGS